MEGEAGEEDVVWGGGGGAIALCGADESAPGDLDDGRDDVAGDEEPEDGFGRERAVLPAERVDEDGEDGVDGGGEEDGRDDDEEIFDDEVDDVVWVFLRAQEAEDVPDYLHERAHGQWRKVPGPVAEELEGVEHGRDAEEDHAEDAKC